MTNTKLAVAPEFKAYAKSRAGLDKRLAKLGPVALSAGLQPGGDIEALTFVVTMQASKSARDDLKAVMADVKAVNKAKAKLRERLGEEARAGAALPAGTKPLDLEPVLQLVLAAWVDDVTRQLDRRDAASEINMLQLQALLDRRAAMMQVLTNLLKQLSDSQAAIIGNIR